jgi:septal ring-binding cell division protein DamX
LLLVGIFMGDSPAAADARAAKGQPAGRAPTTETRADARVEAALRVDHSRAIYAIRIAAETSLESARQHIHAIVQAGGFQPWIAYNRARNRYYVFVGDYANEAAANAASTIVRTLPNEKVWVRAVREDCPYARLHADGYHTCEL